MPIKESRINSSFLPGHHGVDIERFFRGISPVVASKEQKDEMKVRKKPQKKGDGFQTYGFRRGFLQPKNSEALFDDAFSKEVPMCFRDMTIQVCVSTLYNVS